MSSTIEFRHLAISLPSDLALAAVRAIVPDAHPFYDWGSDGHQYLVFAEAGCSNVFDYSNSRVGRVSRRWHLAAAGSRYLVLRTVTRHASDSVLSGGTCLHTRSRWTRPETYIAAYREAMDAAIPYAVALDNTPNLALHLTLPQNPQYQRDWNAREPYRDHLRATGRLEGQGIGTSVALAPLFAGDGLADLAWLTSLGQDEMVPAWTAQSISANEKLDTLADMAKSRARAKRRASA